MKEITLDAYGKLNLTLDILAAGRMDITICAW